MKKEILSDYGCVVIINPNYRWHVSSQSRQPCSDADQPLHFKAGRCAHLNTLTSPTEAKLAETMDFGYTIVDRPVPLPPGHRHPHLPG